MIAQDEYIIYITPGRAVVTIKQSDFMRTGLQQKTIVITSKRIIFFDSLINQIQQIQYQLVKINHKQKKKNQKQAAKQRNGRFSINSFPQYYCGLDDRQAKLLIDQQQSCLRYFEKAKIRNLFKSVTGIVILKNPRKLRFQIMFFDGIKGGFRFCKALICAKAWKNYQESCKAADIPINKNWIRILTDIITSQNSTVLIDPDLFLSGTGGQIKSFIGLMKDIAFAHRFQHKYHLKNYQAAQYAMDFIQALQAQTFSLILSGMGISTTLFNHIFSGKAKLNELMDLQLQNNQLTDQVLLKIVPIMRQSKKLSNINLGHNQITLGNSSCILQLLKNTKTMLRLILDYNLIGDHAIGIIQKYILFSLNPPLEQLDLSFNKFTKKGSWRLYVGNTKAAKNHPYFNFIIYPIPCKKQIFPTSGIGMFQFPKRSQSINFNLHSALVQQFQQQSIMKHTFQNIMDPQIITIKLVRQLKPNIRLPKTKQQVSQTLNLSNKVQNFIYQTSTVQRIFNMGQQIAAFPLNLPPITRVRFAKFLFDRLNEALFIRDHYAVHYILKAMKVLQVDYRPYIQRINRLQYRDSIYKQKVQDLFNFQQDQQCINQCLDQMTKQGLRLYLQGQGVQLVYYLKHMRNKYIQKFLNQKFNPDHFIYSSLARKNMIGDQRISQEHMLVPYQIKVQKRINQNFYSHPWQTNYVILSEMHKQVFDDCVKFLEQSSKKQKFAIFFERIEQRINFVRNQFIYFFYHKFKVSYTDFKVNCCRLIFLYQNITQTNLYLDIPIYIRKKLVTHEKIVDVKNADRYVRDYHIVNYININYEARKAGFYNYDKIMTKYDSQIFKNEVKNLLEVMKKLFYTMQTSILSNDKKKMYQNIVPLIKKIIDLVRHSIYPQQIKQQFYLHIIGWRKGKHGNNTQMVQLYPFLTMYLKPPLMIEKYLVASILENSYVNISQMPLCLVSDINKPTDGNLINLDSEFVERDWLPSDSQLQKLMINYGKVQFRIELLNKKTIKAKYPQSFKIINVIQMVINMPDVDSNDNSAYWIYKCHKQTHQVIPLFRDSCLGQILSQPNINQYIFMLKRRIYSPQLRYNLQSLELQMINSLFNEVKFEYLKGQFYIDDKNIIQYASLMLFIDVVQTKKQQILDYNSFFNVLNKNWNGYIPKNSMKRLNLKSQQIIDLMKGKISQRVLKKHHLQIRQIKINFLNKFSKYPQFLSTLYVFQDSSRKPFKMAINTIYISLDSPTQKQKIFLQSLISVSPRSKYLLLSYHISQSLIQQVALYGNQNQILNATMDILSYCVLRIRAPSNNLYTIVNYQRRLNIKESQLKKKQKLTFQEQNIDIYKKLTAMQSTVIDLHNFIYARQSKYIKSWTPRKLYANKSDNKMDFKQEMDQQQIQDVISHSNNIFLTIFPQANKKKSQVQPQISESQYPASKEGKVSNQLQSNQMYPQRKNLQTIQINQENQIMEPPTVKNINSQNQQKIFPKVQSQKMQNKNQDKSENKRNQKQDQFDMPYKTQTKSVPPENNKDRQDIDDNQLTTKKPRQRLPRRRAAD